MNDSVFAAAETGSRILRLDFSSIEYQSGLSAISIWLRLVVSAWLYVANPARPEQHL